MEITLNHYLAVAAVFFVIGLMGVIMRRNLLIIYMSLEMMLQAANLTFVAFSRFYSYPESPSRPYFNHIDGQVFVFFVITVAAAEVAVGLALIVALYRLKETTQVQNLTTLKF
ncbi:MAG: NADH-quinone oxidoreductase subunit NuoK [Methylacidiphilales bacterium]|nr:NADH-quinone oxidoreductase subunit NuoK [Candidatus Methylacidiphilales bacterium]